MVYFITWKWNAWVSLSVSCSTRKCNKTQFMGSTWKTGTGTFPVVWLARKMHGFPRRFPIPSCQVRRLRRTFVLTKVVISDYKVFMISVSGKLWYQIQNDHWFWNLGFGVLLKSWANLANGKSFSDTFLPKKDNKSTKSSLHSCVYCQCNSMHLFYLFPHLYFDGSASFLRWPRTSYCCEARNYQKKLANDENKRV